MNLLLIRGSSSKLVPLEKELQKSSYDLTVSNARDSLALVENHNFNLLLISDDLDGVNPFMLGKKIKGMLSSKEESGEKTAPIIFITESDDLEKRVLCYNSGGLEVFELSLGALNLLHKIDSVLKPELIWKGLKTIIVEDEKISAKFMSHVLKSKGADVEVFADGLEAYNYIRTNPNVDLVLTDHMMPNLKGVDFVARIRKQLGLHDLPVIFISSVQDKSEILKFYKAGGNDYISKPLIKEELFVKVSQLLNIRLQRTILKNQVKELEELNDVKDQFLAVCSHDLRSPLNTIMGLSNLMMEEESIEEDYRDMSGQIFKSSEQLLEMVNDLLDLSEIQLKKESINFDKVNICQIIQDCLNGINVSNEKNLDFKFESDHPEVYVEGNVNLLKRLFNNLLTNAYKFTPDNGVVKGIVEVSNGETCRVSIVDSGIGIPQEFMDKIFEKLSGTGRAGTSGEKSTGIGMSIVKEICDQHNAQIDIESEENVGTTISVIFKVA